MQGLQSYAEYQTNLDSNLVRRGIRGSRQLEMFLIIGPPKK